MPASRGLQLREGARVFLAAGPKSELLECRVLAFLGPALVVLPHAPPSAAVDDWLAAGSSSLLIDRGNHLDGLQCDVRRAGAAYFVRVARAADLGRRRWSRAEIALDAELVPQPPGVRPASSTSTLDISAVGARVAHDHGTPVWPRYSVTLSGGPLDGVVGVEAVPTRVSEGSLGMRFTHIDTADRDRLAQLVLHDLAVKALAAEAAIHAADLMDRASAP
jgi:hypothetical protein